MDPTVSSDELYKLVAFVNKPEAQCTPFSGGVAIDLKVEGSARTGPSTAALQAADINKDGFVNAIDFSILSTQYGNTGASVQADINKDGKVNSLDASLLIPYVGLEVPQQ